MMNIKINDGDFIKSVSIKSVSRAHSDIIEIAKSLGLRTGSVVSWWTDVTKSGFMFARHNEISGIN